MSSTSDRPLTPEDYWQLLVENLAPQRLGTEVVSLADSHGRTLADDAHATFSVPPFDNSAMDGFAVRGADFGDDAGHDDGPWEFAVVADIAAGHTPTARGDVEGTAREEVGQLPPAARIMTGAPMPAWADAVVPVEDTDAPRGASAAPRTVTVHRAPKPGANVRLAGEDIAAEDLVVSAGSVISARTASTLAAIGYGEVEVVTRPRVAVLATGAELAAPGEQLSPGMIPDSNSTLLALLVREAGGQAVLARTTGDTAADFGAALPTDVDLIVTSGGVSMGAFDPVKEYGLAHGWTFEKVAMQPGKPQGHGMAGSVPVIALPGNPVSVAVSFRLFVRPFIGRLLGQPDSLASTTRMARAGPAWRSSPGRRQYLPGALLPGGSTVRSSANENLVDEGSTHGDSTAGGSTDGDGYDVVVPVHRLGSGSHLAASLHAAQVLAVVDAEVTEVKPGDLVQIIPL
ncbi:molybdopterin molybdotransferase MoeA [Trueperella bialowiezensis]|uniref:Molybdopterin molybdenumtransferase n=1 Tax=Trueperella bialowiezensis TaxID=312285 RepID=A0A3S4WG71_9ACTO|nr:gephyrin-like molybdotransferase Glp [Trueperella bialowiezensis]VEI13173.1 Molybdopterin molybdenumtransferase [Trueperella bialowiezensis]